MTISLHLKFLNVQEELFDVRTFRFENNARYKSHENLYRPLDSSKLQFIDEVNQVKYQMQHAEHN